MERGGGRTELTEVERKRAVMPENAAGMDTGPHRLALVVDHVGWNSWHERTAEEPSKTEGEGADEGGPGTQMTEATA